jgi:hypothetical protein
MSNKTLTFFKFDDFYLDIDERCLTSDSNLLKAKQAYEEAAKRAVKTDTDRFWETLENSSGLLGLEGKLFS